MPPADQELRVKIDLENAIRRWASGFSIAMRDRILADQRKGITTALMGVAYPGMRAQLREHYENIGSRFRANMNEQLEPELRFTEVESQTLTLILNEMFETRADSVTRVHMTNAQDLLHQAVVRSRSAIAADDSLTQDDAPALIANGFLIRERVRLINTVAFETQWAAETTKAMEIAVLLDQDDGNRKQEEIRAIKKWRSQGDSRVRRGQFDHLAPDGQQVFTNEPFIVSGQLLRWPGDSALGATAENLYGCRCSAIYDVASIAELRRTIIGPIFPASTTLPEPTASDLVEDIPFDLGDL